MRRTISTLLSIVAMAFMAALPAKATPILDQSNTTFNNVSFCSGTCTWQQTVTAGLTGQLTGIRLFTVGGAGTATVRIGQAAGYNTANWSAQVFNTSIASQSIVDLSAFNVLLTAGQTFVIDVAASTSGLLATNNTLSQNLYLTRPQIGYVGREFPAYNMAYQTYVDTAPASQVPEPMSLALFALGLLGAGAARRRKG